MSTRKGFLATSAAVSALVPQLAGAATSSPSPAPKPTPSEAPYPKLNFDLGAFDAALDTMAAHRHMFAATKIAGGQVLDAMRGVLRAYADIGVAAAHVHPVAVLYHGGSIFLAFDDAMWNEYFIPLQPKGTQNLIEYAKDFATIYTAKTRGNPCLHKTGGVDDSSIEALVADADARFFVCNNATKGFAGYIARHLKKDPIAVYTALAAHLVPNAMLVPAGVWAVHAIQERRYTYLQDNV